MFSCFTLLVASDGGFAQTYAGSQADAPWRAEAAERIEKIRKGDLTVNVVDANGVPVSGAKVSVRMTRSAFAIGSCVACEQIMGTDADSEKYRATIEKYFNRVVIENELKWPLWEEMRRRDTTMAGLKWLREKNIEIRGHNLVWPSWQWSPGDLKQLKDDKKALANRIKLHVRDEVLTLRGGTIAEWDVVNEPFSHHDILDILGQEIMGEWFREARKCDPQAKLYINDFDILEGNGDQTKHQDYYFETIQKLLKAGVPIDGIGVQCHFDHRLTPPTRVLEILDRFGQLGLPIEVTELDIDGVKDERVAAQYMRDFLTIVYSHPKVNGVILWGFWEGRHWRPGAALWRKDWTIKPLGQAWMDVVTKQWRTEESGETDGQGKYATRSFLGDYTVDVEMGGKQKKTQSVRVTATSEPITVRLD